MMSNQKEYNQTVIAEFRARGGKVRDFATTPLLLLTTIGAKSDQPRITPLAYTTDGDRIIRRINMFTDPLAMEHARQEARLALTNETIPVGSVLIGPDGGLIGRGRNRTYSAGDCSGHAEIEAIRDAGSLLLRPAYFQRCTLYTTAEPCMMCTGAILAAGVIRVVWGTNGSIGCFSSLAQNAEFQFLFSARWS